MKIKCSPCEYGINDPRAITVVVQFLDVRHLLNQFCFHCRHHSLLVIEIKETLWVPKMATSLSDSRHSSCRVASLSPDL